MRQWLHTSPLAIEWAPDATKMVRLMPQNPGKTVYLSSTVADTTPEPPTVYILSTAYGGQMTEALPSDINRKHRRSSMVGVLITILIIGLVVGLVYYVCDALPIPDPLNRIIKIVAVVVGCLAVIFALLSLTGYDIGLPRRL